MRFPAFASKSDSQLARKPHCAPAKPMMETLRRAKSAAAPDAVHEVLRSPGRPLEPATRAFMEPRFGHDFSKVSVHAGAKASQSAREVNALAYTFGPQIVFGSGRYAPASSAGQQLLAHELSHVVQQRHHGIAPPTRVGFTGPSLINLNRSTTFQSGDWFF